MKHTLKRTTYILFSVITPIIFFLLYKFGGVSLKFFAFSGKDLGTQDSSPTLASTTSSLLDTNLIEANQIKELIYPNTNTASYSFWLISPSFSISFKIYVSTNYHKQEDVKLAQDQ